MSYGAKPAPGVGGRATVAFALLNGVLLVMVLGIYFLVPALPTIVWLQVIAGMLFIAGELVIVGWTIGPPLVDWIREGTASEVKEEVK